MTSEAAAAWTVAVLTLLGLLGGFSLWMAKMYHKVSSTHEQLPRLWKEVRFNTKMTGKIDRRVLKIENHLDIEDTELDDDDDDDDEDSSDDE